MTSRRPLWCGAAIALLLAAALWIELGPGQRAELVGRAEVAAARRGLAAGSAESAGEPAAPAPPSDDPALLRVRAVSAETGLPVAGRRVHAYAPAQLAEGDAVPSLLSPDGEPAVTGDDGWAVLVAEPGLDLRVQTEHDDGSWRLAHADVDALAGGERRELVLSLEPVGTAAFHGRVLRRDDRAPIEGATVRVEGASFGGRTAPPEAEDRGPWTTDADGRFTIRAPATWRAALAVEAEGFGPRVAAFSTAHREPSEAREVLLEEAARLRVRAVDGSGAPLAGVRVRVSARSANLSAGLRREAWSSERAWTATTDTSGRCELRGLPPHVPVDARATGPDGGEVPAPAELDLQPGEERAWTALFGMTTRVVGTLVDQHGDPVPAQRLWLARDEGAAPCFAADERDALLEGDARTDAAGRFAIDGVPPGRWLLGPAPRLAGDPAPVVPAVGEPLALAGDEVEREVALRVDRGLYLEGTVLDPDGDPLLDAAVFAYPQERFCTLDAQTGPEGRFRLGPFPAGEYVVHAVRPGGPGLRAEDTALARPGEAVVLRLPAPGELRLAAVDPSTGEPVRARLEVAAREGGPLGRMRSVHTSADVRAMPLASGVYDVAALAEDGRVGLALGVEVDPGEPRLVEVPVRPGGRLVLENTGDASLSFRARAGGATLIAGRLPPAARAVTSAPPGPVDVEVHPERGTTTPDVHHANVHLGETTTVELALPR